MKERYLELTFRKGKLLAAYLYLPRERNAKSARTQRVAPGLLADYDRDDNLIGLELTAPRKVTVEQINEALNRAGVSPIAPEEIAPLRAA
jgi:hypothetical protein